MKFFAETIKCQSAIFMAKKEIAELDFHLKNAQIKTHE